MDQEDFDHACACGDVVGDRDGRGPGRRTGSGAGSWTWAPERGEFPGVYRRMRQDGSQLPGLQGLHEPGGRPVVGPVTILSAGWRRKVVTAGASPGKSRRLAARGVVTTCSGRPRVPGMGRDG